MFLAEIGSFEFALDLAVRHDEDAVAQAHQFFEFRRDQQDAVPDAAIWSAME
jgi:hypothetical protein